MPEQFGMSWLDRLLLEDRTVRDPGTMGWRYEGGRRVGFMYGGTLHHKNGESIPLVIANDDDEFRSWYTPIGDRETWIRAAKLLTDRKRPELDCLIAIGFAAPLMVFTGSLYGAVLSVWGPPGTAKSTAQQVAAAVWGHPKQTRESLTSSPRSVQGRLGRTRNLAAYWDDVQDQRHQESLFQTMFVASEGTEGGRLKIDASYQPRLQWQTLLVACSNASFVEYVIHKQKSTTAGMRRVFEFEYNKQLYEPGMIDGHDARRAFAALEYNFGQIGVEYAQMLARQHDEIDELVGNVIKTFTRKVLADAEEAYWIGICGCLLAGATLAKRLGAEMDVVAMDGFLQEAFLQNRKARDEESTTGVTYIHTERWLTGFLKHCVETGNALFVDRRRPAKVLRKPLPGRTIFIQIFRDDRLIRISRFAMREYLEQRDIDTKLVFHGLTKYFKGKHWRVQLGGGTPLSQAQEPCSDFIVPMDRPHPLQELLQTYGAPKEIVKRPNLHKKYVPNRGYVPRRI